VLKPTQGRLSAGYYVVTALTTVGTSYYFNYLFFLLKDRFGFGDRQNLLVAALHGFIYLFAAWQGGKFAERRGYRVSLMVGLSGLVVAMIAGSLIPNAAGQVLLVVGYTTVLLFIWPALEALVTENQPAARIPHMIGLYNCTWSGAAAVAYFTGGTLYEHLRRGAIFGVPAVIFAMLLIVVWWLDRAAAALPMQIVPINVEHTPSPALRGQGQSASPETFLKLAWLANPFSYVAIYTLLAVMPGVAGRLGLSASRAGLYCSLWFFGRLGAFALLWRWVGWHYRFRWLLSAFVLLIVCFVTVLLSPTLWLLVVAELGFGLAAGLIYYSSLFYAMDAGAAKAEHGGLHEAAIGIGICAGPAVGALSLTLFPAYRQAAATAVTCLLLIGLTLLIVLWRRGRLKTPV
jgi:predicted MFS family arabinose efflux permease